MFILKPSWESAKWRVSNSSKADEMKQFLFHPKYGKIAVELNEFIKFIQQNSLKISRGGLIKGFIVPVWNGETFSLQKAEKKPLED